MPNNPIAVIIKDLKEVIAEHIREINIAELRQMKLADLAADLKIPAGGVIADIIKAENETKLLETLKKISQLSKSLSEVDKYQNNLLHWCVLMNYPGVFQYFLSKGFGGVLLKKLNIFKLNTHQLAVILNREDLYLVPFSQSPDFSESAIEFYDIKGGKHKAAFNDLHLAIIYGHATLVRSMVEILLKYYIKDNYELESLGNIFHLFSYASLDILVEDTAALDRLRLCLGYVLELPGFKSKALLEYSLNQSTNNYERLVPISVAASGGQEAWVNVLTPYYEHVGLHKLVADANALLQTVKQEKASPSTTGMFASPAAAAAPATPGDTPSSPSFKK